MIAKRNKEDAVSPVIGILLMLVVTIIIAAVVSSFASGLTGGQAKAPQASIEERTDYFPINSTTFTHKGGDSFDLKNIAVVFQEGDTTVQVTTDDVGTHCLKFEKMGAPNYDTTINAGDRILITGTGASATRVVIGGFSFTKGDEWMIVDKKSSATICRGLLS